MFSRHVHPFAILFCLCVLCSSPAWSVTFGTEDLAGTWYGHQVVTGDAPADDPRWGYGTVTIDNAGNYTADWTSPSSANEITTGMIQINSNGLFTVNNQPLTHGVMNDAKDLLVFTDGTQESKGHALVVLVKRGTGTGFSNADFAGFWYGYHVVSGDAPGDDPRWGYGSAEIDDSGNYEVTWNSPTSTNELSAGSITTGPNGIFTINNQPLMHGVINDAKDFFIFIDGTAESAGNALSIFIKRSPAVNTGTNLLLLNALK